MSGCRTAPAAGDAAGAGAKGDATGAGAKGDATGARAKGDATGAGATTGAGAEGGASRAIPILSSSLASLESSRSSAVNLPLPAMVRDSLERKLNESSNWSH